MTEPRHFLSLGQLSKEELSELLDGADAVKAKPSSLGSKLKNKATSEDLSEPANRGSDGRVYADVSGFGPGPGNPS